MKLPTPRQAQSFLNNEKQTEPHLPQKFLAKLLDGCRRKVAGYRELKEIRRLENNLRIGP